MRRRFAAALLVVGLGLLSGCIYDDDDDRDDPWASDAFREDEREKEYDDGRGTGSDEAPPRRAFTGKRCP